MRLHYALLLLVASSGCATGTPPNPRSDAGRDGSVETLDGGPDDAGPGDAGPVVVDSGTDAGPVANDSGVDGGTIADAGIDAGRDSGVDAGPDSGSDAGRDSGVDAGPDSGVDAGAADAGGGCGLISAGHTIGLDGVGDAAEYPASQVLTPGASLGAADTFALTWDRDYLYITLVSPAFEDAYKPLHVYLEARSALGAAEPSSGKEYGGLAPFLPFSPTHLIAVRRTTDSGTGGPYNGIYEPAASFATRATSLDVGTHYWVSADNRTFSVRVPWAALDCPSELRLSAHVVNGGAGTEWKDVVPASAEPWTAGGASYYEIDLSLDPAISGWALR